MSQVPTCLQAVRAFGYSWAEISSRLGITRQAALWDEY